MNEPTNEPRKLDLLLNSFVFLRNHFPMLLGLGLIAAFGRVIQLGGFGPISAGTNIALEVVVEGSRILLFLYVLGMANVSKGIRQITSLFTDKSNVRARWNIAKEKLKKQWVGILFSFVGFLLVAGVINLLIDQLAYQTCLYLSLKREGILVDTSSEWTILLFFKNISVIPFTFVFETVFILWITNQLTNLNELQNSSTTTN